MVAVATIGKWSVFYEDIGYIRCLKVEKVIQLFRNTLWLACVFFGLNDRGKNIDG
jgi:hypothetical protein